MKKSLLLVLGWMAVCQAGGGHRSAESNPVERPAAVKVNDGVIFDLDFNSVKDGAVADRGASRCRGKLVGAEVCQGVDGYGVRLPGGHACVNVELPEADRRLDAFSLDLWVSPEEAAHQEVVTAASRGSDFDDLPIMLRWRQGWQMWLSVQTIDNQRRCMACEKRCLDALSFPRDRSWIHVVATYDGRTSAIYVNGRPYQSQTWPEKKAVMPIAFPVKVGGHGGLFRGAVDNFRMYRRALTAEEALARYQERLHFRPQIPPRKIPGTIDGMPYSGCGRGGSWAVVPLRHGAIHLSNTGEMELWGVSSVNPSNQFDFLWPIGVLGQAGQNERYYRELSGNIQLRYDGTARLDLAGRTKAGLEVQQSVEVNARDEVCVRYQFAADNRQIPAPGLMFTQHLWASALRFAGYDDRGLITGNMMDLDGDLWLRDLLEINLVSSDNRLVVKLGPETRLHVRGSRDPALWLNGYTSFPGEITGGGEAWGKSHRAALEATFQFESDDLPCRLDRHKAREVTANVPFDFSRLYEPERSKLSLAPQGRDAPIFMDDEAVAFDLRVPEALQARCRTYAWTLSDAETGVKAAGGEVTGRTVPAGSRRELGPALPKDRAKNTLGTVPMLLPQKWDYVLPKSGSHAPASPRPGVYLLEVQGRDADDKRLADCRAEVVIAGEIPQAKAPAGQGPKLRKVDEADLTAADPGHDFFSFSNRSQVVRGAQGSYRRTLTYQECRAELVRQGLPSAEACDWFGVRFRTTPGKIYVLEIEYPDLEFMSASAFLVEPKADPADGRCRPISRTASGLFTGSFLPHDRAMHVMQIAHFASAPWVAACWQNAHYGRPSIDKELDPACAKRMTLYEVEGDLPALDAPSTPDRQVGVYCESGGLALSSFGPKKFRGENGNWDDRPEQSVWYRNAYPTVANLIRYLRYRGDTTLFYGIYRYRAAGFPSRTFPPASSEYEVDLPALVARMFERNGLRVVFNVMANNPLPTSRLHEFSHYDIIQGANAPESLNQDGRRDPPGRASFPSSNPFHPAVREAYCRLAAELGERYGKFPAVAGISWLTGQSWWEPCITAPAVRDDLTADEADRILLGATCDDETMRQFERWAGLALPGKPPEPDRFAKRYRWIQDHAREKFLDFRCWAMAQTHLAFQRAFAAKAPGKDYLAIDFYYDVFSRAREWSSPLDAVRRVGFGPSGCAGTPGFVYSAYLPELNGCTYWEHSTASWEITQRIQRFLTDDRLARALDYEGKSARFLHRQFYEQRITLPSDPKRRWMWAPDVEWMVCVSYPQQGGRGYLADFAYALARGTPNYISYSWCDSTIPLGHEPMHRQVAAAYRNLPAGRYHEADRNRGVFVRVLEGRTPAFYVVNTTGEVAQRDLHTGCSGTFCDAVAGQTILIADGRQRFRLQPYECKVFLTPIGHNPPEENHR
jgi:hypothetical protein